MRHHFVALLDQFRQSAYIGTTDSCPQFAFDRGFVEEACLPFKFKEAFRQGFSLVLASIYRP
jgi:hypothetical protein